CLVSPCEFQHPRTPESRQQPASNVSPAPDASNNNNNNNNSHSQDQSSSDFPSAFSQETPPTSLSETPPTSLSEAIPTTSDSAVPPCSEDCPSITADLDSDDDSCRIYGHVSLHDPPPAPIKDLPPLPPQPGACMADTEASRDLKSLAAKTKKPAVGTLPKASGGIPAAQNGKSGKASSSGDSLKTASGLDTKPPSRNSFGGPRGAARPPSSASRATGSAGSAGSAGSEGGAVYVDLAYLPSGCASSTVDRDLFRRLRSSYYIISGDEPAKEAAMRNILDALLDGKISWPETQRYVPEFT
ncbi:microtubule-associated protein 1S-like, partial [Sander vitreus]